MLKQAIICVSVVLFTVLPCFAHGKAGDERDERFTAAEVDQILGGVKIDMSSALEHIGTKATPYTFGVYLIKIGHHEKAREWFQALTLQENKPEYLYGLALALWRTGDNNGALKSALFIQRKNPPHPPTILHARNAYLLASIYFEEGQFALAQRYATLSYDWYSELGKDGGRFLATLKHAWIAVGEERYDAVERLLDEAYTYNEAVGEKGKTPYSRGHYHEVMGESLFGQGDLEGALREAIQAESEFRIDDDIDSAEYMTAKVALLMVMTGETKSGAMLADKVWEKHNGGPRSRVLALNSITLMKLARCSQDQKKALEMESAARAWAARGSGGKGLLELLDMVKSEIKTPCLPWK